MREKDAVFSIAKDIEFSNSRKILEGRASLLRQEGFRKRPNATKALTSEDEELLWSKGSSSWEPLFIFTDTDHVVLAHPALWNKNLTKCETVVHSILP